MRLGIPRNDKLALRNYSHRGGCHVRHRAEYDLPDEPRVLDHRFGENCHTRAVGAGVNYGFELRVL